MHRKAAQRKGALQRLKEGVRFRVRLASGSESVSGIRAVVTGSPWQSPRTKPQGQLRGSRGQG